MRKVQDSLDSLIPSIELWPPFELGQLPRVLKIHCPEVPAPVPYFL